MINEWEYLPDSFDILLGNNFYPDSRGNEYDGLLICVTDALSIWHTP